MRKNIILRRILAMTAAMTLFASGSAYAENTGKIDTKVYKGLSEVLESRNEEEAVPENSDFVNLITYTKDRMTARFAIKLPHGEKVKADDSESGLVVVEIPAGIISTSEIRKDINDRYVSAYELYSDDESYIFEMELQENVEASCFVNE